MISAFPSPILSVAADVVKDLEGEDALCSLWACAFSPFLLRPLCTERPFFIKYSQSARSL